MTPDGLAIVDAELQAGLDALAAAECAAQARGFITGYTIAQYVNGHPLAGRGIDPGRNQLEPPPPAPEFLACDEARVTWLVRWPNGQTRWEAATALERRLVRLPAAPLLGIVEGTEVA